MSMPDNWLHFWYKEEGKIKAQIQKSNRKREHFSKSQILHEVRNKSCGSSVRMAHYGSMAQHRWLAQGDPKPTTITTSKLKANLYDTGLENFSIGQLLWDTSCYNKNEKMKRLGIINNQHLSINSFMVSHQHFNMNMSYDIQWLANYQYSE